MWCTGQPSCSCLYVPYFVLRFIKKAVNCRMIAKCGGGRLLGNSVVSTWRYWAKPRTNSNCYSAFYGLDRLGPIL
jgi:hypothetical protein